MYYDHFRIISLRQSLRYPIRCNCMQTMVINRWYLTHLCLVDSSTITILTGPNRGSLASIYDNYVLKKFLCVMQTV